MKIKFNSMLDLISIGGGVVSFVGLLTTIIIRFKMSDKALISAVSAGVSVLLAFLSGLYSQQLSRGLSKLSHIKRVFLSYPSDFEVYATRVAQALRHNGAKVWIAEERIKPGEKIEEKISQAIDDADNVVVFLSKGISPNMLHEINIARAKRKRIIPVLLESVEIPADIQGLRYIDLRENKEDNLQELVRAAS
ncbi:MAG: toll/interleukin-1 receptor domain-containing protein [bacterium]